MEEEEDTPWEEEDTRCEISITELIEIDGAVWMDREAGKAEESNLQCRMLRHPRTRW